jgi:hypothetical protein
MIYRCSAAQCLHDALKRSNQRNRRDSFALKCRYGRLVRRETENMVQKDLHIPLQTSKSFFACNALEFLYLHKLVKASNGGKQGLRYSISPQRQI